MLGRRFPADCAEAVATGLVRRTGTGLEFASALVRGVVYHDIPAERRKSLHARHTSLRHRIAAADPPDEALAAEIALEAARLQGDSRTQEAAVLLAGSLPLTKDRGFRLVALEAMLVAGDLTRTLPFRDWLAADRRHDGPATCTATRPSSWARWPRPGPCSSTPWPPPARAPTISTPGSAPSSPSSASSPSPTTT